MKETINIDKLDSKNKYAAIIYLWESRFLFSIILELVFIVFFNI